MRIEHLAIWTPDLERLKAFYITYFGAVAGAKYSNADRQFASYFLTFESGARLELMIVPALVDTADESRPAVGLAHLAFAAGSEAAVDALTQRLRADGFRVLDGPRRTGDGNRVEITV